MRVLASLVLMLWASLPVSADDGAVLRGMQASRVIYDAGVANRDPLLIIAAAKLRRGIAASEIDRAPEATDRTAQDGTLLGWQSMLDDARQFAADDPLMLGLIEDVAAEATKGVVIGPVYNIARVGAGQSDTYRDVPFAAGEYAEIYVEAQGTEDLNLFVRDAENRLVCSDTDPSAIAYCGWRPRTESSVTIVIENTAGRAAQYSLITN